MGKVWNISGSFFGSSNLIPENATFTKLEVLPTSLDTYYNGELFRPDLTFFQATFTSDEGEETKISLPSSEVDAKNFDPNVPFSNTLDREYQTVLQFEWTYKPDGDEGEGQYRDCSFTVTIWPEKFTVKKVEVIVPPNKTVYYDGEVFDEEGMVVQATSEEGDTKQINYCGDDTTNCNNASDCYWYSRTPLRSNDSETTEVIFNYCVPADAEHPNGYVAQFTYPVTVYQDERKAQLKVTYDEDIVKRLYYSGETLNTTGIKVERKYPRDDDSAYKDVSTECKYSILGQSNNTLNYNNSDYGSVTIHIEYYDSVTELTSTYDLQNVVYVFEVDRVIPDTSVVSSKTYRVDDVFSKIDMPIDIVYKPTYEYLAGVIDNIDSIKVNNKLIEQTSTTYSIVGNQWIDSQGTFLKSTISEMNGAPTSFAYISPLDGKSNKTTHSFTYTFYIERKIYKVMYPSDRYTGSCSENSQGVQALQHLNLFDGSGTQSTPREGIGKIEVQDMTGYTENVENNLTKYYKSSEGNYQWTVTTYLKEDTDEYHYVWDNYQQSTDPWVSTFTVKVNLTRQLQVTESSISLTYDWNEDRSPYAEVTVETEDGSAVSISTDGSSRYCTLERQSSSTLTPVTYRFIIEPVSGANSTYNATYTFKTSSSSSNEWSTTTYSSATVGVTLRYINYTPPWTWNTTQTFTSQSACNEWWSRFKSNVTRSNYNSHLGKTVQVYFNSTKITFKCTGYANGYLGFMTTSKITMTTWGAESGRLVPDDYIKNSLINTWSAGQSNPVLAAKELQSAGCSGWYSVAANVSKIYAVNTGTGGSSINCNGKHTCRIWIPSFYEIEGFHDPNASSCSSTEDNPNLLSGASVSGTFWLRNGSYAGDSTTAQRVGCYYSSGEAIRTNLDQRHSCSSEYFCFKVALN